MLKNLFTPLADRSSAEGLQRRADWDGAVCGWGWCRGGVSGNKRSSQDLHLCICSGNTGLLQLARKALSAPDQQIFMRLLVLKEWNWLHMADVYRSRFVEGSSQSRGQTLLLYLCEPSLCCQAQDNPIFDLWVPWLTLDLSWDTTCVFCRATICSTSLKLHYLWTPSSLNDLQPIGGPDEERSEGSTNSEGLWKSWPHSILPSLT